MGKTVEKVLKTLLLTWILMVTQGEEGKVRQPLPSAEEIAALPPDGGPEFNRLIFTHSPYLLQHARNPVDWYPWGDEAFERARREDKPVFLSIGYTTCHWCHVMEHESFEDAEVADFLNKHYISVKVDREERPDIDEVYMTVTQALTGGGGWPMTVILTPDKKPFFSPRKPATIVLASSFCLAASTRPGSTIGKTSMPRREKSAPNSLLC